MKQERSNWEMTSQILEIIGTAAFAFSGSVLGIKIGLDIFGVIIVGLVTAVGGGITRDIIMGLNPPSIFSSPEFLLVSVLTSVLIFVIMYLKPQILESSHLLKFRIVLDYADALGLGIFTVIGCSKAMECGNDGLILIVFLGVLTGVGGGVLRDMMCLQVPYIFKKHIYAVASMCGALLFTLTIDYTGKNIAMISGVAAVVLIRIIAMAFRLNLPKVKIKEI